MDELTIKRSLDIEDVIRQALDPYFIAYVPPLPEKFTVPSLLIQRVGGTDENTIDTFDVVIDSRAEDEATADENLRTAIGALKEIARLQKTSLRHIKVNSIGSWGSDPVRPELSMCTARIRAVAHEETITIGGNES